MADIEVQLVRVVVGQVAEAAQPWKTESLMDVKSKLETIVLIHGFGGCRTIMMPLANRLTRLGFRLDNWGYHSFQGSVEEHALSLRSHLTSMHGIGNKFHIVAHSLGCVIVRSLHAMDPIRNLGRVVFLTPPHHGSPVARRLSKMLGWCIPVLRQLSDTKESFVCRLPPPKDMEFGELTAHYDFLIATSSMHLLGESDFAVVGGTHGSILFCSQTAAMIASFLRTGKFDLGCTNAHLLFNRIDSISETILPEWRT